MKRSVTLNVNGTSRTGQAEPRTLLCDFLRDTLRLTGTHVGCEHGICGACTIRRDAAQAAKPVRQASRASMRVLHARHADDRDRFGAPQAQPR